MITIQKNKNNLSVDTNGGYVTKWNNILYQGSELKRTGIPILFPNFGKSDTLGQHGFGRNCKWRIVKHTDETITMRLTHEDVTAEINDLYPRKFIADISVSLEGENAMIYELKVENRGTYEMPISPGIHPYWAIKHEDKKKVKIKQISQFKAHEIDWDHNPADMSYPMEQTVEIEFPDYILTIEDLSQPKACTLLQVWSQPIDKPDYNFICFEPITRDNYALEQHPILIQPGEEWHMKLRFTAQ